MAVYGVDFYGSTRYGPRIVLDYDAGPMAAVARTYSSLELTWKTPTGAWSLLRVVRNSYGTPATFDDGQTLFEGNFGPAASGTVTPITRSLTDNPLLGGNFYYYAIFLYVPASQEWTRAASTTGLALKDHGYSTRLWELTPAVHRSRTGALLESDNEQLQKYLKIPAFQLDHIRGEYESLRYVNDPDRVSGNLLPLMAQQWGQVFEPEIGMAQMRTLLRNTVHLYRTKGTMPGVLGFVSALTGYSAKIQPWTNLALDYNDSSFEESIGRWITLSNCTLSRYAADGAIDGAPVGNMRRAGLLKVVAAGGGSAIAYVGGPTPPGTSDDFRKLVPVTAGQQYTLSAYMRAVSTTRTVVLNIHWYRADGTFISSSNSGSVANTAGTWTRHLGAIGTAPTGTVYASFGFSITAPSANEVHYFDAFQLEQGNVVTPFEDARLLDINIQAPRVNEVTNPNFETSTQFWNGINRNLLSANQSSVETDTTGLGGGVTRSTAQALSGTASLRYGSGLNAIGQASATLSPVPVVSGQVYTAMASGRTVIGPSSVSLLLQITFLNSTGGSLLTVSGAYTAMSTAGWQQATCIAQAPAGAASASVIIFMVNSSTGAVPFTADFDAMGLFETPLGNLISNPDFDNGQSGWVATSGLVTHLLVSDPYMGRQALQHTASSAGNASTQFSGLKLVVGQTYTASAWIKKLSGAQSGANIYLAQGTPAQAAVVTPTPVGVWTRITHTFVATSTTANLQIYCANAAGPGTSLAGVMLIDAVQLVAGPTALEYLPTATTNLVVNPSPVGVTYGAVIGTFGGTTTNNLDASMPSGKYVRFTGHQGFGYVAYDVPPGIYTVSQWWRSSTNLNLTLYFEGTNVPTTGPSQGTTAISGTWTKVTRTVTLAGTGSVKFGFLGGVAGQYVDVSSVQLEAGSVATPYVDGNLGPGFAWEAAENLISNPSFEVDTAGWDGINRNLFSANQSSFETSSPGGAIGGGTRTRSTAFSLGHGQRGCVGNDCRNALGVLRHGAQHLPPGCDPGTGLHRRRSRKGGRFVPCCHAPTEVRELE